ncbi:MAG: hypothetical protein JWN93_2131 [Hyphomicrobiales bacterium]|nr:hypothetical protein [Hyphomicrobiales bacterium]
MTDAVRAIPGPKPDPETQAYWDAANAGRLLVRSCNGCGRTHHYPRSICPFCFSEDTQWNEASGEGTIYSFSVMRRANPPYALAFVTLAEGPTMMTNIVDCDLDALRIGQKVRVTFQQTDTGYRTPVFTPL